MKRAQRIALMIGAKPRFLEDGLPMCDERCPHHDGKRCGKLGFRAPHLCEPTLIEALKDDYRPFDEQAARALERNRCVVICNQVQEDERDTDNVFQRGAVECAARIHDAGPTLSTREMMLTLAQRVADAAYQADKYAASGGMDESKLIVDIEAHVDEVMNEVVLRRTT